MIFRREHFAYPLTAPTLLCGMLLGSWTGKMQQGKHSNTPQPEAQENFTPSSDYELKIVQGEFLVRQKGTTDWRQSSKIGEPIVVGTLDGDHNVYIATKVINPPKASHMVNPSYPSGEEKSGKQGMVSLHMIVDDHGVVQSPVVDASPGPAFAAAALEAARKWTFKPATWNGSAVAVLISLTMEFRLY